MLWGIPHDGSPRVPFRELAIGKFHANGHHKVHVREFVAPVFRSGLSRHSSSTPVRQAHELGDRSGGLSVPQCFGVLHGGPIQSK